MRFLPHGINRWITVQWLIRIPILSTEMALTLHKNLLPTDLIGALRSQIDSKFDQIESAARSGRSANEVIGATERYIPTASSFTIGAAVSQGTVDLILSRIADAPTGRWIKDELENEV